MDSANDLLLFPAGELSPLSIRAKALAFADPRSRALLTQLDARAEGVAPVALQGAWGTGKELLARRLHQRSGRAGLFVTLNCATLSRQHGAAELFGYLPRAYAGAVGSRMGWFGSAQSGTLYLDEIADLPPALQEEVAAVLQHGSLLRVGSTQRTPLDIRLVAGASLDLAAAVHAGRFAPALWQLLEGGLIEVPPLRERPQDILPLARHFLAQQAQRLERPPLALSEADERALLAYPWPGNVRELEQVLHAALLTEKDGRLRLDTQLAALLGFPLNYPRPAQS